MDWILIITLVLGANSAGGKYAAIESLEFTSADACEVAKETYLKANQAGEGMYVSAVCVSEKTVITRRVLDQ